MPTITYNSGIYTMEGEGFYAILSNSDRIIHQVGYLTTGKIKSAREFVADTLGLDAVFGGKLPAFLFLLYSAGVEIANPDITHDIDKVIQQNGLDFSFDANGYVEGQYDKVQALDFCVLTGRKNYPYLEDHMNLPQNYDAGTGTFTTTKRPALQEVPNGDNDYFLDVIKHLGLSGIIARMYAKEAMTWDEYLQCAVHFWLGNPQRIGLEIARLQFLLPKLFNPSLTQDRKAQLLAIAEGDTTGILSL